MPAEAAGLLEQLLILTQALEQALVAGDEPRVEALLDQRQALLDQLAALPEESRRPDDTILLLLAEIDRLSAILIEALEERRQEVSSSQKEMRTAHTALQAYLPQDEAESHYIEEES